MTQLKTMQDGRPSAAQVTEQPDPAALPMDPDHNQTLYLMGRPSLKRFLRFVHREVVSPPSESDLVAAWQAAKEHVRSLERSEPEIADGPHLEPIEVNGKYEPLLVEFLKDPLVKHGFNTVPTEVAFVELDQMVVYQHHIDLTHVEQLKRRWGNALTDEDIFRICLPHDHPQPPVKWNKLPDSSYVFVSPSNDLRYLGSMQLERRDMNGVPPPGDLLGVVGAAVGFGSNFLNAYYAEGRLVLNNGSHRAYALRALGITRVPCIVQHVSTRDELQVVASTPLRKDPDRYLKRPRPSMLKDYFDPKLHRVFPVRRQIKEVTVKIEVRERFLPAL